MSARLSLTPLGHSCVLVDVSSAPGRRSRVLLDPGSLSPPLDPIPGLDGILVTHAHHDHLDVEQVRRATKGRQVAIFGDPETAGVLRAAGLESMDAAARGTIRVGAVDVQVMSAPHRQIYPGLPLPENLAYLVAGQVFAPGDSFLLPPAGVEVLLVPTGAPWMKLSESIDYLRAAAPPFAVPIHDGGLGSRHRELHVDLMERFAPAGTIVLRAERGVPLEIG